jgi:hypothetical protein
MGLSQRFAILDRRIFTSMQSCPFILGRRRLCWLALRARGRFHNPSHSPQVPIPAAASPSPAPRHRRSPLRRAAVTQAPSSPIAAASLPIPARAPSPPIAATALPALYFVLQIPCTIRLSPIPRPAARALVSPSSYGEARPSMEPATSSSAC